MIDRVNLCRSGVLIAYDAAVKNDNQNWPYPIRYGEETAVDVDVVVGGWNALRKSQ